MSGTEPIVPPSRTASGPVTLGELLREARSEWLELDRGALGTVVDLTLRPARVFAAYLDERRRIYVRPLRYLLFSVALQVATGWYVLNDPALGAGLQKTAEDAAQASWFLEHAALLTLLILPLVAAMLRLCMHRQGMRYVDALVVAGYTQAQVNLFGAAVTLPVAWSGSPIAQAVVGVVALVYVVYAWSSYPATGRRRVRVLLALLALVLAQAANGAAVWAITRLL